MGGGERAASLSVCGWLPLAAEGRGSCYGIVGLSWHCSLLPPAIYTPHPAPCPALAPCSYQRTCPTLRARCQPRSADGSESAPVHLVVGHAGAGLTPNTHFRRPTIFQTVQLRHGYMRVRANATHMAHQVRAPGTHVGATCVGPCSCDPPVLMQLPQPLWYSCLASAGASAPREHPSHPTLGGTHTMSCPLDIQPVVDDGGLGFFTPSLPCLPPSTHCRLFRPWRGTPWMSSP